MKTEIQIDTDNPGQLEKAVSPSLDSTDRVSYVVESDEGSLDIEIETDGLGSLRGCTDTAFRLTSLTEKILR
jgi:tRNA threonylcarbamoyladenosine modification (KEOPS) complex  Pcc1 subunit